MPKWLKTAALAGVALGVFVAFNRLMFLWRSQLLVDAEDCCPPDGYSDCLACLGPSLGRDVLLFLWVVGDVVLFGLFLWLLIWWGSRDSNPPRSVPGKHADAGELWTPPPPAVFVTCPGCGKPVNLELGRHPYCQTAAEGGGDG